MLLALDIDMERQRKTKTFRLDELVIEKLGELARRKNMSANRLVENILLDLLKSEGAIAPDTEPLGETRGGDQKSKEGE